MICEIRTLSSLVNEYKIYRDIPGTAYDVTFIYTECKSKTNKQYYFKDNFLFAATYQLFSLLCALPQKKRKCFGVGNTTR